GGGQQHDLDGPVDVVGAVGELDGAGVVDRQWPAETAADERRVLTYRLCSARWHHLGHQLIATIAPLSVSDPLASTDARASAFTCTVAPWISVPAVPLTLTCAIASTLKFCFALIVMLLPSR